MKQDEIDQLRFSLDLYKKYCGPRSFAAKLLSRVAFNPARKTEKFLKAINPLIFSDQQKE